MASMAASLGAGDGDGGPPLKSRRITEATAFVGARAGLEEKLHAIQATRFSGETLELREVEEMRRIHLPEEMVVATG